MRNSAMLNAVCISTLIAVVCAITSASDVLEAGPLTSNIVVVHFCDGHVVHHRLGQKRTEETVITNPLDVKAAMVFDAYHLTSSGDANYSVVTVPFAVQRKSKGVDFAWHVDRWENNHAVNDRPDHVDEHWIYLFFPSNMRRGIRYTLETGKLAANGHVWSWIFDDRKLRSEAVHVNEIGYSTAAPVKYAYVYQWMGDAESRHQIQPGHKFHVLDANTRTSVFDGPVTLRAHRDQIETGQAGDTPHGNFENADVSECDFSRFNTPGRYVISVDSVGCSFPFSIGPDVYREPYRVIARALYHNRSGIALTKPFTEFVRPAPHNPLVTPGFAGKLKYTSSRFIDWKNEDADMADKPAIEAGIKGPLDVSGWYQDAGDWDSYYTHLRVPEELLIAYEINPTGFSDHDLNIPESGNGIPDILGEAGWLPRFCFRLRHELLKRKYGTGGIGLRICGDHFGGDGEGMPSYLDVNRTWIASGEDPVSTFGYAGVAAHFACVLQRVGKADPDGIDWKQEAIESYAWGLANTQPTDVDKAKPNRAYASAALFRLTGETRYEAQLKADTASAIGAETNNLEGVYLNAAAVYLLGEPKAGHRDPLLAARLRAAIVHTGEAYADSADKRALRWAGDWFMPMLVGQQTTPLILPMAVAWAVERDTDAAAARRLLSALYTTADYFLGTNALNTTWATGLGPRSPRYVFHMDAWYNGKDGPHPGVVPYGPWKKSKEEGQGPWDNDWANKSVYPAIDQWPSAERWFNNRCAPLSSEFTIHQTIAPSAAIFGILCGPVSH